jgi:hypothetical protein
VVKEQTNLEGERRLISQKSAKIYNGEDVVDFRKDHADSMAIVRKVPIPVFRKSVK